MNEQKNLLSCGLTKDLLPLYRDGVVCEETAEAVKAHLETCESCAAEYEGLCAALPVEENTGPKSLKKFVAFQKRLKNKKILTILTAVALTCAVLLTGFFLLTRLPLVSVSPEEVELRLVFRYESEGKEKLFLAHSIPWFSFQKWRDFVWEQDSLFSVTEGEEPGEYLLEYETDRPVFSERGHSVEDFTILELPEGSSLQSLRLGEKLVWTAEREKPEQVPGYVYEIDKIRSERMSALYQLWPEFRRIDIQYPDGRLVIWDLDGQVLYRGMPDENGLYPDAPDARYIQHEYHGEDRMGTSYSKQGDLLDGTGIIWSDLETGK